jgi:hypothetical protein
MSIAMPASKGFSSSGAPQAGEVHLQVHAEAGVTQAGSVQLVQVAERDADLAGHRLDLL